MKKKRIILFTIVISLSIAGYMIGTHLYEKAKEESFDEDIMAQYGEDNYLGRQEKEIKILTQEELKELNPTKEYDTYGYYYVDLEGRFNKEPITNIYEAREVLYGVRRMFGIMNDPDAFLYGEAEEMSYGTHYVFFQFYKGVSVGDGRVDVFVDSEGNTTSIWNRSVPEIQLGLKTVKPKYNKKRIIKKLKEIYPNGEVYNCYLEISLAGEETERHGLVWVIEYEVSENKMYYMDANTGEILEEQSLVEY